MICRIFFLWNKILDFFFFFLLFYKSEFILWVKGGGFKLIDGLFYLLILLINKRINGGILIIRVKVFFLLFL